MIPGRGPGPNTDQNFDFSAPGNNESGPSFEANNPGFGFEGNNPEPGPKGDNRGPETGFDQEVTLI